MKKIIKMDVIEYNQSMSPAKPIFLPERMSLFTKNVMSILDDEFSDIIQILESLLILVISCLKGEIENESFISSTMLPHLVMNDDLNLSLFKKCLFNDDSKLKYYERLKYIVIKTKKENNGGNVKFLEKIRDYDFWILENKNEHDKETIDYFAYLVMIEKIFDSKFNSKFRDIIESDIFYGFGYKNEFINDEFVQITSPMKLIISMINDLKSIPEEHFYHHMHNFFSVDFNRHTQSECINITINSVMKTLISMMRENLNQLNYLKTTYGK